MLQTKLSLGPALMPDFMTGAQFVSILAWPTIAELGKFHEVTEEIAGRVIRATRSEDPALVEQLVEAWPQLAWPSILQRSRKRKPALGYLEKRLKHRMAAAKAGIAMLHEQLHGMPGLLPDGITDLSIDQLCTMIRSDVHIDDPHNIERDVWRASLPIMHVAMATQLLIAGRYRALAASKLSYQDIDFYRWAVLLAFRLEEVVDHHPKMAISRDRMTLVRWYE